MNFTWQGIIKPIKPELGNKIIYCFIQRDSTGAVFISRIY